MAVERTLSIIKPGAVAKNLIGKIIARFEEQGLCIIAARMIHLTEEQARAFYAVRPFIALVLEGENAIAKNRELMGATDPSKAVPGTIRGDYGRSITRNTVHGSDSPETAVTEINFFFSYVDLFPRAH